jgi:ataxia telangiectasia mutated family protein
MQGENLLEESGSYKMLISNRYRPGDITFKETQARLKQISRSAALEDRLKTFMKLRERFKPVLRYFFTEQSKLPISWYTRRLTYARSVATSSIGMGSLNR